MESYFIDGPLDSLTIKTNFPHRDLEQIVNSKMTMSVTSHRRDWITAGALSFFGGGAARIGLKE